MPFQFHNADASPYRPGDIFLGTSETGHKVGITLERHLLTVAGARRGKGAALIVPNLRRWPHSAVVVDAKGENTFLAWQERQAMGQRVYVLDPFREADVPDSIRASFNPLAAIDPASPSARSDIRIIADGLVIRYNAKDGTWDNGAVTVLAGLIAHVITTAPPKRRTLASVRDLLNLPAFTEEDQDGNRPPSLADVAADMAENPSCGGLAQTAAAVILRSLTAKSGTGPEFVDAARTAIDNFGDEALQSVMADSSFRLSELKTGRCTVFLVLPSRYIADHARFFRLFVRLTLNEMEKPIEGKTGLDRLKGTPCLFVLDEFAELGRVDALKMAAGRLAGNGVHLWPFLQNFSQLPDLYGTEGAKPFIANADALTFFGIEQDDDAQRYASNRIGVLTQEEIGVTPPPVTVREPDSSERRGALKPPASPAHSASDWSHASHQRRVQKHALARADLDYAERDHRAAHDTAMNEYAHAMRRVGRPRLPPDEIARVTGRGPNDEVARSMIVFGAAGQIWNLSLAPYFRTSGTARMFGHMKPASNTPAMRILGFGLMAGSAVGGLLGILPFPFPLVPFVAGMWFAAAPNMFGIKG
ncbi:type IV secretory system conjugative DNA transfer family protein [Roseomonas sp. CECT 9278]|uniref:type IV secretory system conjugative DNA transfer family protein n=1 Tax=Roseomonas sp. CECT 9278 TaxID=2845823 RepID=UPI001E4A322B|nr:type IV secretory system conjugative DNA transfer family protein [Roseomonas sp. CECT 9278]CAH0313562.1 hypothetical protein ROS9278_05040 [Roseomonas sp. CECT 9278]